MTIKDGASRPVLHEEQAMSKIVECRMKSGYGIRLAAGRAPENVIALKKGENRVDDDAWGKALDLPFVKDLLEKKLLRVIDADTALPAEAAPPPAPYFAPPPPPKPEPELVPPPVDTLAAAESAAATDAAGDDGRRGKHRGR
jgi:hypothetical protein